MKFAHKILVAGAVLSVFAASALAANNPVGSWKGKMSMDASALSKIPAAQQQMIKDGFAKTSLALTMKANKTFVIKVSHGAMGKQPAGSETSEGTWKQSGNTITLTNTKDNGKESKNKTPINFTLSKDGKSMTLVPGQKEGGGFKLTFTK